MCGALLLVATKLFGAATGMLTLAVAAPPFAVLWFAMPLWRRGRLSDPPELDTERHTKHD
jgi:hypothetical protein